MILISIAVEEVGADVLEPLLHLLRASSDVEVQRAASAALGNLAVSVGNKLKIVRLGGLEPLMRQMQSSNVEVQCNAVGCITNLATHEENKSAIARSGALGPLTRLAKSTKDVRVQRNATGALLNMTHSEDNRRELVTAGAIPVLVSLLKGADPDVVYYSATALSNLAVDGKPSEDIRFLSCSGESETFGRGIIACRRPGSTHDAFAIAQDSGSSNFSFAEPGVRRLFPA